MQTKECKSQGERRRETERRAPAEQPWEAKLGRTKGNKRKAKYIELEEKHVKPGRSEKEKPVSESGKAEAKKPL